MERTEFSLLKIVIYDFPGAILPIITSYLGYDPAVVSAPLMTTIVDSSGLIIYFATAKIVRFNISVPDVKDTLQ